MTDTPLILALDNIATTCGWAKGRVSDYADPASQCAKASAMRAMAWRDICSPPCREYRGELEPTPRPDILIVESLLVARRQDRLHSTATRAIGSPAYTVLCALSHTAHQRLRHQRGRRLTWNPLALHRLFRPQARPGEGDGDGALCKAPRLGRERQQCRRRLRALVLRGWADRPAIGASAVAALWLPN